MSVIDEIIFATLLTVQFHLTSSQPKTILRSQGEQHNEDSTADLNVPLADGDVRLRTDHHGRALTAAA